LNGLNASAPIRAMTTTFKHVSAPATYLATLFLTATALTCSAATPPSQNFDAISPQESTRQNNPSLTFDGITYSTDSINDALRIDTIENVTGALPTLGTGNGLASVWYGTNTGTFFQFASVNNADNFMLLSLRAEVWGGSSGTAEIYTISGYDDGVEVANATVTFTTSGLYGSGDDAIDYTRQTTSDEDQLSGNTANAGLLIFGSSWNNIDQVRFTVADAKILGVGIDNIVFDDPQSSVVPEPAHTAVVVAISAFGLIALTRHRRRRAAQ
jgi:hypothetical protein